MGSLHEQSPFSIVLLTSAPKLIHMILICVCNYYNTSQGCIQEGKHLYSFQILSTCAYFPFLTQNLVGLEGEVKFCKYWSKSADGEDLLSLCTDYIHLILENGDAIEHWNFSALPYLFGQEDIGNI